MPQEQRQKAQPQALPEPRTQPPESPQLLQFKREIADLSYEDQSKQVRPTAPVQLAGGSTGGGTTGATPSAHPRQADLDADKANITPVAGLQEYKSKVQQFKVIVKPKEKTSVILRITKLYDAIPKAQTALIAAYKTKGPQLIKEFIDDRLKIIESTLNDKYMKGAKEAHKKIEASGAVNEADRWEATWAMINWDAFGPEELVSEEVMDDTAGVMKVYDAWEVWGKMKQEYKTAWNSAGGRDGFVQACTNAGKLLYAPPGQENKAPFKGASVATVFPDQVYGFVGLGRDLKAATSFADAITRFALTPSWYPSKVMFGTHATADQIKSLLPSVKIGKPSIMYLLRFDENTYDESDRVFGHLADPKDPTKPGKALELQCAGLPISELLGNTHVLT